MKCQIQDKSTSLIICIDYIIQVATNKYCVYRYISYDVSCGLLYVIWEYSQ